MGEDPGQIREDIERTREQMSDTVEAIGYKADVPSRTKEKVTAKKDAVVSKATGATPDADEVKHGARRAKGIAQENPVGLAIGGAAVGFLVGLALPSTPVEDEKLGPMADDVKAKAQETGREALERGKQVAQDAAEAAKETAQESGQRHGEELKAGATS
jgi:ElaB/YqjD/DUF883 family membrane-anchored ribosome-binding protein